MWIKVSPLIILPSELLVMILNNITTSKPALGALGRTCRYLRLVTLPILFSSYTSVQNGDTVGLIKFVRSLLNNNRLGCLIKSVCIDDNGYLSSRTSTSTPKPLAWVNISGKERMTYQDSYGHFHRGEPWGSFDALKEWDWEDGKLMNAREWTLLEMIVTKIVRSQAFLSLTNSYNTPAEDGRRHALRCLNISNHIINFEDNSREAAGINEDDPDARVEKFNLRIVDRWLPNEEGWNGNTAIAGEEGAQEECDGWRYDEDWVFEHYVENASKEAPGMWIRALRRGSRDAWSALMMVLATGVETLENTSVNWFARPDPSGELGDLKGLSEEEREEVQERYGEEDESYHSVWRYTWVGRIMAQCAAYQSYSLTIQKYWEGGYDEILRSAAPLTAYLSQKDGRNHTIIPLNWHRPRPTHPSPYQHPILPRLRSLIIGSSPNPQDHTNLSLNTLLHFLQPPLLTSLTAIGLTNSTFGLKERKPIDIHAFTSSLVSLTLLNSNATPDVLGYLISFMPKLETFTLRMPSRTIYRPTIVPGLAQPDRLVQYLAQYCERLQVLDLDTSNAFEQHGFNCWSIESRIFSFSGLRNLRELRCRVEHIVGNESTKQKGNGEQGIMKEVDDHACAAGPFSELVFGDVLPRSLEKLVVGIGDCECSFRRCDVSGLKEWISEQEGGAENRADGWVLERLMGKL